MVGCAVDDTVCFWGTMDGYLGVRVSATVLTTVYRIPSMLRKRDRINPTPLKQYIIIDNPMQTLQCIFPLFLCASAPLQLAAAFLLMANRLTNCAHMTSVLAPRRSQVLEQVQVKLGGEVALLCFWVVFGGFGEFRWGHVITSLPHAITVITAPFCMSSVSFHYS